MKICKYVFIHLDISVFCCGDLVDNKVILPETKCKQINKFDQVFLRVHAYIFLLYGLNS